MIPAERIQQWATQLAPSDLGAGIIVAGALCGLLSSLLRAPRAIAQGLPAIVYVVSAAAFVRYWMQVSLPARSAMAMLSLAALWLHFRRFSAADREVEEGSEQRRLPVAAAVRGEYLPSIEDPFRPLPALPSPALRSEPLPVATSRLPQALLLLGFALTALLLFDDLGGYAGTLLAWESPVVQHGFVPVLDEGVGFWDFLYERLLWDDGVLSAGHTSLFYGPPTFALFRSFAATPWTLRIASVVATLLAMAVLFRFVRRYFDRTTATAAAVVFGLNSPILFYGRYGSSIAGSILAVLLAFYATWFFLERRRWTLLRAGLCGAALFVATLQYAPSRLAVLFLLGTIPFALVTDRRSATRSHWVGLVVIALMAAAAWSFETANHREHYFLHARGEQVFGLFNNPNTIPALVGTDRTFTPAEMNLERKIEVVRLVIAKTFAELVELMSPNPRPRVHGAVVVFDPPPMSLYFAPLAILALLGIVRSLTLWRRWRYTTPLLFTIAYCAVLLFTNRIDPHRGALLVVPLALWCGLGVRELADVGRRMQVPASLLSLLAVAGVVTAAYADVNIRYDPAPGVSRVGAALAAELDAIRGPTSLWFARDHRELSWLGLRLLEKGLRSGESAGTVLPQAISDGLRADKGGPRVLAIRQVTRLARLGTLLLGPQTMFLETAQRLQAQGLRVSERRVFGYGYFRIDGGAQRTGVPDSEFQPMVKMTPLPTAVPLVLSQGPRVFLSDLPPAAVEYGFAAPKMNKNWQGGPVVMSSVVYEKAIGTHAWTTMRFDVPPEALLFQAIVGLSDETKSCDAASVEFEVRGADNTVLWKSPVFDYTMPPQPVEVPIAGQSQVTLATTEAGDGRDCDHANWANPAFVYRAAKTPAPTPTQATVPGTAADALDSNRR